MMSIRCYIVWILTSIFKLVNIRIVIVPDRDCVIESPGCAIWTREIQVPVCQPEMLNSILYSSVISQIWDLREAVISSYLGIIQR